MKAHTLIYILISGTFFMFLSCEKIIPIHITEKEKRIVMNCLMEPQKNISLQLSKSMSVLDNNDEVQALVDADAKLFENGELLFSFPMTKAGIYDKEFIPKAGKEYKLKVNYNEMPEAVAYTKVPIPVEIAEVDTFTGKNTADFLSYGEMMDEFMARLKLKDPANEENYYLIQVKINQKNTYEEKEGFDPEYDYVENYEYTQYITSNDPAVEGDLWDMNGLLFSDRLFNGKTREITFSMGAYFYWAPGENEMVFQLHSVSKEYYLYLLSKNSYQRAQGNPFAEPVQVYSNIENGLGIFASYSTAAFSIIVEGDDNEYYPDKDY